MEKVQPMRSLNSWSLLLLLSTLTACSTKPSADKLTKELQTVESWAVTAHMVGDSWLRGAVPTFYAKQTLQTAQEELQKETTTLTKVAPVQDRTKVINQLQRIENAIGQMVTAVEQKDRSAMAQKIQQLSTQEQAIKRLVQTTGGQS